MKIAFVYMQGRIGRLAEVDRGEAPSEFFYGAVELAREGIEVAHFEIKPELGELGGLGCGLISTGINWVQRLKIGPYKTDGRTICQAAALCRELNGYDLVVATASKIAFALALCAKVGRLRVPILGIQCGLLNHTYNPVRQAVMGRLLGSMHSMLFGESELEGMRSTFGLAADRLSVNQFGVDTGFWTPGETPPVSGETPHVLSVGNDSRRDYDTLLAAAGQIAAPMQIVTSRRLPAILPPNVTHLHGSWHERALSDLGLRDLYRQASCVVIALKPSLQPSGQSVALQAMACGKPVILTDTEGLWSRETMVDGTNVVLCRPNDPGALAAGVRKVLDDPQTAVRIGAAARQHVCQSGDIKAFAAKIRAFCGPR